MQRQKKIYLVDGLVDMRLGVAASDEDEAKRGARQLVKKGHGYRNVRHRRVELRRQTGRRSQTSRRRPLGQRRWKRAGKKSGRPYRNLCTRGALTPLLDRMSVRRRLLQPSPVACFLVTFSVVDLVISLPYFVFGVVALLAVFVFAASVKYAYETKTEEVEAMLSGTDREDQKSDEQKS